ncbi:MAG: acyl-CoA dehydrogenase family protein [Nocardioides sp.]|uniref:acyl-CoA dehydrogenase family protein n=1 Tax=Nocardioides sp. TaxID=35761 RepID=UPI0039E3921B
MDYAAQLDRIIDEVIAPNAAAIDGEARFPREAVDALAAAGVLALTVPATYGGAGLGLREAADVVGRISTACGSTAMVVCMHYAGTAALVATDREDALREIAEGRHLTTLAFSETGSRSHFWAPLSTATGIGDEVLLAASKSWVTSGLEATSYVWSSTPLAGDGPMTLWYVRRGAEGLTSPGGFDGLGLRGNGSVPLRADDVRVAVADMLGADGAGLDIALAAVLPVFLVLNASASLGLARAVTTATAQHLTTTSLGHLGQSLAQQLPARTRLARMQIESDRTQGLIDGALTAVEEGRPEAQLLVLETKAAADETAAFVADTAMAACGGAAFRKELAVERRFRDSRAARVMAPTTDALLDFIGRAMTGQPLLDAPTGPAAATRGAA